MTRTLVEVWALASLALLLALGSNHRRGLPIRPGQQVARGIAFLNVTQVDEYLLEGAVAVDTRDPAEYERGHLPGAVLEDPWLPFNKILILYGDHAEETATRLLAEGYRWVAIMPAGWTGWQVAHK